MAVKGVDISEMNGSVDFAALKRAGVKFVIIRCGYGSDYPGQHDTEFERNVRKAEAAKMPWGVYHYSYAKSAAGGKAEAAHALRLIGNRKPAYGVWYDMEDNSTIGGNLAGAAEAFCSAVKAKGLHAGVYANLNWWENYLTSPVFDKYDRWAAQYNSTCDLKKPYSIWQFTDRLVIGGKAFDGNWDYKIYKNLEDDDMTDERVLQLIDKADPMRHDLKDVPAYWREDVAQLVREGAICGDGKHQVEKRDSQLAAMVAMMRHTEKQDPIYRTIDDVPEWGRPSVQALIDAGKLAGECVLEDGTRILNIRNSTVRIIRMLTE